MYNRSSKSGLFLIELIILILFFAMASGICVQLFVNAHLLSIRSSQQNHAVLVAQSAAEAYKANAAEYDKLLGGKSDEEGFHVLYNTEWQPLADENSVDVTGRSLASYRMDMRFSTQDNVGTIDIRIYNLQDDRELYQLTAKRLEAA